MRLTLVSETYAPQVNGVSRTLGELVRCLRAAGDVVQLIHPDYGRPPESPHDQLVATRPLPFYREVSLALPPFGAVHRAIDAFGPDLIHIATEATLGLSVLRHATRRRLPVVSSFHTNFDQYGAHYRVGWIGGLIWRYLRWFHNRTSETYVPSRSTIADLEARGFRRLVLWPRGVDAQLFRPDRPERDEIRRALGFAPDAPVIVHVGRLAPEKNVEFLGQALDLVARAMPLARILIVGDGPSRPALEATLADRARFVGYRTGDDLADHFASGDLFAMTSKTETFGNVVLEAMSCGLPVVGIAAGGVGETIKEGRTGLLIPPAAPPSALADRLTELLDDAVERRRMADAARQYALSQSWHAIMGDLRSSYLRVIAGQGQSSGALPVRIPHIDPEPPRSHGRPAPVGTSAIADSPPRDRP
ncbi:glycosyltransferase family 1 protein [Isosphaeraceae bacterium EP7]